MVGPSLGEYARRSRLGDWGAPGGRRVGAVVRVAVGWIAPQGMGRRGVCSGDKIGRERPRAAAGTGGRGGVDAAGEDGMRTETWARRSREAPRGPRARLPGRSGLVHPSDV